MQERTKHALICEVALPQLLLSTSVAIMKLVALVAAEAVTLATAVARSMVDCVTPEAIALTASAVVFPPEDGGGMVIIGSPFAPVTSAFDAWMLTKSESIKEGITNMMINCVS